MVVLGSVSGVGMLMEFYVPEHLSDSCFRDHSRFFIAVQFAVWVLT